MAEKKPEGAKEPEPTGLPPYLFIRNLSRDPESRVARRLRPGNSIGFLLDDGRRIRRAGGRPAQVDMKDVIQHASELAEGVKYRYIEVTTPDGKVVPVEALLMLCGKPELAEKAKEEARKVSPPPPPAPEPPSPPPMTQVIPEEAFTVMLMDAGENKVLVAREIRNATGLGLTDVQHMMESAPKPIKEGLSKEGASSLQATLEKAGAKVSVVSEAEPSAPPSDLPSPDFEAAMPELEPAKETTKVERAPTKKPGRR